jgi:plastocyanin
MVLALSLLAGGAVPLAAQTPDWSVPNGHYFTQTGSGSGGFTIADDDGLPFWSAFRQLGAAPALGFPASRRFTKDGFVYQLTQAAMLQHRPDQGGVVLGNTFELLQESGRDDWLRDSKGIPAPIANDGSTSFADAVQIRLGWLTEPAIRERYFLNPNPSSGRAWGEREAIDLYGLPMSRPEQMGPFVAQRFQRIAFQLWVQPLPGLPAPGTVTAVLGGDLLKEAGLVDGPAVLPHGAGAVVSRPVALGTPSASPAAPTVPPATATPRPAATPTPRPAATPRPSGPVQLIESSLSEYSIYLSQITVKPGTVRFSLTNVGVQRHNLRVVGNGIDRKSVDLVGGRSGQVEVTFVDTGPYYVYCDIADHEDLGMALTLNVSD